MELKMVSTSVVVLSEGVQYKKVTKWKSASSVRKYWTQVSDMYNMQGHGLAVKNTGALCDKSGGRKSTDASSESSVVEPIPFISRTVYALELAASRRSD